MKAIFPAVLAASRFADHSAWLREQLGEVTS